MNRTKLVGLAMAAALGLAACGGSYDRQDAIDDLIEGGLDEATAVCVVDGIEENFSIERLESTGDLTAEEEATLTDITLECLTGG